MIRSFLSKLFGQKKTAKQQPEVPKSFKQTNRSLFMNRYAGGVYFLIVWHIFGYFLISSAREKAEKDGWFFSFLLLNYKSKIFSIGSFNFFIFFAL